MAINHAFSVQHACGLSTTPTLLYVQVQLHMLKLSGGMGYQIVIALQL